MGAILDFSNSRAFPVVSSPTLPLLPLRSFKLPLDSRTKHDTTISKPGTRSSSPAFYCRLASSPEGLSPNMLSLARHARWRPRHTIQRRLGNAPRITNLSYNELIYTPNGSSRSTHNLVILHTMNHIQWSPASDFVGTNVVSSVTLSGENTAPSGLFAGSTPRVLGF